MLLPLPTTGHALLHQVIVPALAILPVGMDTPAARCMLVAIPKQESDLKTRRQGGNGPARSLYQFERTGVAGVIQHHAVDDLAAMCCLAARIPCASTPIMAAIEQNDLLACQFARLNLYTDPHSLPKPVMQSEEQAWHLYLRVWRPGAAKEPGSDRYMDARHRWQRSWSLAVETLDD